MTQTSEKQPSDKRSPVLLFGAQHAQRSHICVRPIVVYEFTPTSLYVCLDFLNALLLKANQHSWWSMGRVGSSKVKGHQNSQTRKAWRGQWSMQQLAAFTQNIICFELIIGFPVGCKNRIRVGWTWCEEWNQRDCCSRCDSQTTSPNIFRLNEKALASQHDACALG